MSNPYRRNNDDLDDLLQQVDDLLVDSDDDYDDDYYDGYDSANSYGMSDNGDVDEYTPRELNDMDDTMVFQNFSNHYGADIQNYANRYGGRRVIQDESPAPSSIPAYNADFKQQPRREPARSRPAPKQPPRKKAPARRQPEYEEEDLITPIYGKQAPAKPRRRRGCGCGCSTMLLVLVILIGGVFGLVHMMFRPPKSDDSIGSRKRDTASILLCGVDADGVRTDTMMLMYMSGSEHKVGLLSIPRDTYILTSGGNEVKLNAAYGLNNAGEEGMEGLLDHIQKIIGYRPDGYILVDFNLVPKITDLMGGVQVDVPMSFELEDVQIEEGLQTLNGDQVLQLLRYREGYYNADLGRIEVQRSVIKACMEQWVSPSHLGQMASALKLVENNSLSSLSTSNYLWMAKTVLLNLGSFSNETLPGYPDMIDGISYYLLDREQVAQMVNQSYNPYKVDISAADLDIAG